MISRRAFLARSAASAAAFTVIPSRLVGADGSRSPNSRLALAGVGVGGVGFGQLKECAEAGFQIVALCDVDDSYAKKAYDHWPQARRYRDFREMLAAEGDQIDAVYHPFNFRGWWDFWTGALGDMGCHHFNTPFRALQLGSPARICASATRVFAESAPLASIVTYDFPARDAQPPLRAVWYDGGLRPATPRHLEGWPLPDEGTLYVGEKGALLHTWAGLQVFPEALGKRLETVPRTLPRRRGTWGEWAEACRGGEPAGCNFKWAEPLTEIVLLGNIAIRTGKLLEWDAAQGNFTNSPDANRQLHDDYQNGWSLETV